MNFLPNVLFSIFSVICPLVLYLIICEYRYGKKVTYLISFIGALVISIGLVIVYLSNVPNPIMNFFLSFLPILILEFLISKNKGMQFIFIFCSVNLVSISILAYAKILGSLFPYAITLQPILCLFGFLFFSVLFFIIKNYLLQIQKQLKKGWTSLALTTLLFNVMMYLLIHTFHRDIDLVDFGIRSILFYSVVVLVYIIIFQSISNNRRAYEFEQSDRLLNTELALKDSQLELKELYYRLAYEDSMTGLKNRTAFEERKAEIYCKWSELQPISCIIIDLNNLKQTNDAFGHAKGDDLICSVATVLNSVYLQSNDIYRIGGDEFLVLFSSTPVEQVTLSLLKLYKSIELYNASHSINIDIAVGMETSQTPEIIDIDSLIHAADQNMYANKCTQHLCRK